MTEEQDRYAHVFDQVAEAYTRERPTYPDELVDQACAGLHDVLEVGCGTGQLTTALVARGLVVDALDPAPNMLQAARGGVPPARFIGPRFEDFEPQKRYDGILSASAFHWVDPTVSWDKAAAALKPKGRIALIQHFGLSTPDTAETDAALEAALRTVDPAFADSFPTPRDLETIERGIAGNVSAL